MTVSAPSSRAPSYTSAASNTQKTTPVANAAAKLSPEQDAALQTAKALADSIEKTPADQLTPELRKDYSSSQVLLNAMGNAPYLAAMLGSGAGELVKKFSAKADAYMKDHPNADLKDIEKFAKTTFSNECLGAKIFKDVIDKMLQETMSRIREMSE
ncbi:hypothetical protein ACLESD_24290 [Pyxidicoccus sp. 3LFB2]